MTRRRLDVSAALALSIALALVGFRLLSGPMRTLEQTSVLALFSGLRPRVGVLSGHTFQVLPAHHSAFRAYLTPFCSSLVSLLALAAIALCVLRGKRLRRLFAFVAAAVFVLGCNVLRIAGSLWAGLQFGPSGLVLFHDWLGTIFGLLYTLGGFLLMLYLMLPSATAQIPRAARTSDVL
ncbi:MAG TPA: exosortase/archaeosortase family protein [Mycobacteriales bacterium]|jgi:carbamoyl-phosphate synthase large subunit|nr:exosortase/archaeosortase family protein [Mycobacteriales bacterium]